MNVFMNLQLSQVVALLTLLAIGFGFGLVLLPKLPSPLYLGVLLTALALAAAADMLRQDVPFNRHTLLPVLTVLGAMVIGSVGRLLVQRFRAAG